MLAGDDFVSCLGDGFGALGIENAKFLVGARRGFLHLTESCDMGVFEGLARNGEVLDGALGLRGVEGVLGDFDFAHGVVFDAEFCHCAASVSSFSVAASPPIWATILARPSLSL